MLGRLVHRLYQPQDGQWQKLSFSFGTCQTLCWVVVHIEFQQFIPLSGWGDWCGNFHSDQRKCVACSWKPAGRTCMMGDSPVSHCYDALIIIFLTSFWTFVSKDKIDELQMGWHTWWKAFSCFMSRYQFDCEVKECIAFDFACVDYFSPLSGTAELQDCFWFLKTLGSLLAHLFHVSSCATSWTCQLEYLSGSAFLFVLCVAGKQYVWESSS